MQAQIQCFKSEIEKNNHVISQVTTYQELQNNKSLKKMSALLSIEEGGAIEGDLEKLEYWCTGSLFLAVPISSCSNLFSFFYPFSSFHQKATG